MAVAAMLDAGADEDVLLAAVNSIPAEGFKVEIKRVSKNGIDCADFSVILDGEHENHDHDMEYLFGDGHCENHHQHGENHVHRTLPDIEKIIDGTEMTERAASLAKKIFAVIAEAESAAHGIPVAEVHFHEVGAVDSVVDVIALAVCFDNLTRKFNIRNVYVPYVCEGSGTVRCRHGILPVPVPAVVNIAKNHGISISIACGQGEFVTPTGAAFVAAVKTDSVLPRKFTVTKSGLGAGKRAYKRPGILRVFIIEEENGDGEAGNGLSGSVIHLEANIDDSTGEALGFTEELLMNSGALDVYFVPCFMKKNRPAYVLNVLCSVDKTEEMERVIFLNTTTIGIRRTVMERTVLPRTVKTVRTQWGEADVKTVSLNGIRKIYPEYESVRKLCRVGGVSFDEVYREIIRSAEL